MIDLSQRWVEILGQVVIDGTAVAAVTLVLALALRCARPALLAALWTVSLIKFLVPIDEEFLLIDVAIAGDQ